MRRITYLLLLTPAVLAPLALAACDTSRPAGPTHPASTVVALPSTSPSPPATSSTTSPAPSRHIRPAPATSASPAGRLACRTADLRIDVLRGSGISGRQFASISFTNISASSCAMSGVPQARLVRAGAPLDEPAVASGKPAPVVTLAPGRSAATTLVGFSTCNAPNSDAVRIAPPGQTTSVDAPLVLRGCQLEVDPVTPAS